MASPPRRSNRAGFSRIYASARIGLRAAMTPLPRKTTLAQRLAAFPTDDLPLDRPVAVYWNDNQIPYVEAKTDLDGAFVLGLVHGHLRLGQMEMVRRISQGRLAELGGPALLDVDRTIRTLGFGRVSRENAARIPTNARAYAERFLDGVNHVIVTVKDLPHEFRLFGLKRESFTLEDIITAARLGGADATWLTWFALLSLLDHPKWETIWQAALEVGVMGSPAHLDEIRQSLPLEQRDSTKAVLLSLLDRLARTGSNSAAVAGSRTASGSAMIVSDPHLGVSLPNIWLMAGLKSPSYNVVGLMPAGLPVFALARTEEIAWGGTNLRSGNSDLVDVSGLPAADINTQTERIRVRFWNQMKHKIRMTPHGPIVTDAPLFPDVGGRTLALKWVGHMPSEEFGAMLAVQRARDWKQFRAALSDWSVTPQALVYADRSGNVGVAMATKIPRRPKLPDHIIVSADEATRTWSDMVTADRLPALFNPPEGFVVSANTPPVSADFPIGTFCSGPDRAMRMREVLAPLPVVAFEDLRTLHADVLGVAAVALQHQLLDRMERLGAAGLLGIRGDWREHPVVKLVVEWDGQYATDSRGARAFEALLAAFMPQLFDRLGMMEPFKAVNASGELKVWLARALNRTDDTVLAKVLRAALPKVEAQLADNRTWGDVHRLRLNHALAGVPVIGKRYRFADVGYPGSIQTLLKSAHTMTGGPHQVRYGSQARHISDLSDPDANFFCLLGGNDGWFNSSTFLDNLEPWLKTEYIRIPLRAEAARAAFTHHMTLSPNIEPGPNR